MFCSLLILFCVRLLIMYVHREYWVMEYYFDYTNFGPSVWYLLFPNCGSLQQSPIDLSTETAIEVNAPTVRWFNWKNKPNTIKLKNTGHTAMLIPTWQNEDAVPYVKLSNLPHPYIFNQLHLHWGSQDAEGSEHTLNGKRYPLEMHVALFRKDFGTYGQARRSSEKDALAVITMLYMIGETNFPLQRLITRPAKSIKYWGMWVHVYTEHFETLVPPFYKDFFMYNGSLTTPPCTENVLFIVSRNIRTVGSGQLIRLRQLKDLEKKLLTSNFRPIQELNNRPVYLIS